MKKTNFTKNFSTDEMYTIKNIIDDILWNAKFKKGTESITSKVSNMDLLSIETLRKLSTYLQAQIENK